VRRFAAVASLALTLALVAAGAIGCGGSLAGREALGFSP